MRRKLERIARMDAAELGSRLTAWRRTTLDRAVVAVRAPRWQREHLGSRLADHPSLAPTRAALARHDWAAAHRELTRHFAQAPRRFVTGRATRAPLVARILRAFPSSACQAAVRAQHVLDGRYDLLGYRGLRFDAEGPGAGVDWHFDPVHQRRAPRVFWTAVPYLDPSCGDHKIIWELNRHQHWLTLGRAFWLTGDERYRDRFIAELQSWLLANPPLVGINWASMLELGLRSISWLWALAFFLERPDADRRVDTWPWTLDLLLAVDRQLLHVERHLSCYFSPNTHLLGEALALYVSGCALPELAASPRRASLGRRILLTEVDRQIAPDGGHREGSAHYHRYTLDFYLLALTVARINRDPAAVPFAHAVSHLAWAARLLADDHGRLPHIGDDDGGALMPLTGRDPDDLRDSLAAAAALLHRPALQIGEPPEEALWLTAFDDRTGAIDDATSRDTRDTRDTRDARVASAALTDVGYYVSRTAASDHLVIDGGSHGYQNGGHAHADALSLTFSIHGAPFLIDPGTACYTVNAELRDRFRSTALHNTLVLDDGPQSIPNGPFHWLRVANAQVRRWRTNAAFDYFDGAHDGYRPLSHRRYLLALHGDLLVVADRVDGPGTHTAAVHWHLDPRWAVEVDGWRATFTQGDERLRLVTCHGAIESFTADERAGLGWYSPVYGRVEPATTLRIRHRGAAPLWTICVFDLRPSDPVRRVERLPVWSKTGVLSQAGAFRISRDASTDYLLIAAPGDAEADRSPLGRRLSRIGTLETDAQMLFYRAAASGAVSRLALVDGSLVRSTGRQVFHLELHALRPDYFADFGATQSRQFASQGPCAGSQVS